MLFFHNIPYNPENKSQCMSGDRSIPRNNSMACGRSSPYNMTRDRSITYNKTRDRSIPYNMTGDHSILYNMTWPEYTIQYNTWPEYTVQYDLLWPEFTVQLRHVTGLYSTIWHVTGVYRTIWHVTGVYCTIWHVAGLIRTFACSPPSSGAVSSWPDSLGIQASPSSHIQPFSAVFPPPPFPTWQVITLNLFCLCIFLVPIEFISFFYRTWTYCRFHQNWTIGQALTSNVQVIYVAAMSEIKIRIEFKRTRHPPTPLLFLEDIDIRVPWLLRFPCF